MSFTNFTGARPPFGNIVQPGAYSVLDASALATNPLLQRVPTPAVIGTSLGGVPLSPMYFRSPGQAHTVLRGGPGHDMVQHVFAGGASIVCFVRGGNSPTQASLILAATSGTGLTLTALDYGSWCNAIQVTVATGPVITLQYTDPLGFIYTEKWDFTGSAFSLAQMAQAINGTPAPIFGFQPSNYVTALAGAGTLPLTTVSAAPLTGGTDGLIPVSGDWTNMLAQLESQLIDIVVPATGDATVHAQVLQHCLNMSQPTARRERVMTYGGVLGESVAATVTRAGNLRDKRAQIAYPGIQDYNPSGVLTLYDPFYAAGRIAGMHCSLPDQATSLTHKPFPCVGVEVQLSTVQGGAIDALLNAGVTPIAPAPVSGFWVVDSLSTYNTDATFRDIHKIRSADVVASQVRFTLESAFVGGKNVNGTQEAIGTAANAILDNLVTSQIIRAHQPTIVTQGANQNTFLVNLPVMLIDTTKYIFITIALQPSSILNTATTATGS